MSDDLERISYQQLAVGDRALYYDPATHTAGGGFVTSVERTNGTVTYVEFNHKRENRSLRVSRDTRFYRIKER